MFHLPILLSELKTDPARDEMLLSQLSRREITNQYAL